MMEEKEKDMMDAPKEAPNQKLFPHSLAEVFTVRINNLDGKDGGNFYGRIIAFDGKHYHSIYDRKREDPDFIKPGNRALLLTGPTIGAVWCLDMLRIRVVLKHRDRIRPPDHVISNGSFDYHHTLQFNDFNKPLSLDINGKYGSATLVWAMFTSALEASIEVTLLKGGGEREDFASSSNIYGRVTAANTMCGSSYESVLFGKNSGEYVRIRPGHSIPLSRSIVAVPYKYSLIVRADLYVRNNDIISSSDDGISLDEEEETSISGDDNIIAKGSINFSATECECTFEKNISGKHGEIRVKVTFVTSNSLGELVG